MASNDTNTATEQGDMNRAMSKLVKRVLMVPPQHFSVEYNINPWMGGVVDKKKAMDQWLQLKHTIEKAGVEVLTLDQVKGLPDMVFVCNSGLVYKDRVYLSTFRHKERTGEQEHYLKWFKDNNFNVLGDDYSVFFEGGGDAVFSTPNTLWAGYGFRSDKSTYEHVKKLGEFDVVLCELTNPHFYHMDTCFTPVDDKCALWYPAAFKQPAIDEIHKRMPESIMVSEAEANAFVCNAVTFGSTVITPPGMTQTTKDKLNSRGYQVQEVDMSEFMKSGGGCQCLVLKL